MEAQLHIPDGTAEEMADLVNWLSDDDELRGRIHPVRQSIPEDRLGLPIEVVTVTIGGASTALATALRTWLISRRSKVKITVHSGDESVTVEREGPGHVWSDLAKLLKADDGS